MNKIRKMLAGITIVIVATTRFCQKSKSISMDKKGEKQIVSQQEIQQ